MSESFSLRISFYFVFGPSQANLELMYAKVIASSINTIFRWKFNISVHQWDPMKIYWFRTVDRAKKLRRRRRRRILINWFSTVDLQSNSNRQKEKQLRAWQKKNTKRNCISAPKQCAEWEDNLVDNLHVRVEYIRIFIYLSSSLPLPSSSFLCYQWVSLPVSSQLY